MVKPSLRQKTQDGLTPLIGAIRNISDFPKPGILFRDITPLLGNARLFKKTIDLLAKPYAKSGVDYVVGIEARGFIFGSAIACRLGCGFVPMRKKGKLPHHTVSVTYDLEYGQDTLEIHRDAFLSGKKVLIADDVLATGGTSLAAAQLVEKAGGEITAISFLVELLPLNGRAKISRYPVHSLIQF
ncbi:MAG: adenine phosphoribosyltransferase [Elusimicrobia bacterium]|nr:adenine phosphoribosyltransferase [Elusimicrobiota bacterium]